MLLDEQRGSGADNDLKSAGWGGIFSRPEFGNDVLRGGLVSEAPKFSAARMECIMQRWPAGNSPAPNYLHAPSSSSALAWNARCSDCRQGTRALKMRSLLSHTFLCSNSRLHLPLNDFSLLRCTSPARLADPYSWPLSCCLCLLHRRRIRRRHFHCRHCRRCRHCRLMRLHRAGACFPHPLAAAFARIPAFPMSFNLALTQTRNPSSASGSATTLAPPWVRHHFHFRRDSVSSCARDELFATTQKPCRMPQT